MTEIQLKPVNTDKKSDQKKVTFRNEFFYNTTKEKLLPLRPKNIGSWTIEKEERCNICWVNIKVGEAFTTCTSCSNKFHKDHWREWIISKQSCPICKVKTTY